MDIHIPGVLGQVVGVAQRVIEGVNEQTGKAEQIEHPVIQVVDPAGKLEEHPVSPELTLVYLSADDQDLLNWIRIFQHIKADLADNGQIDNHAAHLAEVAEALHLKQAAAGWATGLLGKLKGLIGGKK